jgi:hypothetical protein
MGLAVVEAVAAARTVVATAGAATTPRSLPPSSSYCGPTAVASPPVVAAISHLRSDPNGHSIGGVQTADLPS